MGCWVGMHTHAHWRTLHTSGACRNHALALLYVSMFHQNSREKYSWRTITQEALCCFVKINGARADTGINTDMYPQKCIHFDTCTHRLFLLRLFSTHCSRSLNHLLKPNASPFFPGVKHSKIRLMCTSEDQNYRCSWYH